MFRSLNKNITANQIVVFLHVAAKEGVTQKELEKATDLDNGTVFRICAILSERGLRKRGASPLDLIRIDLSHRDYRARTQSLSTKGKRFFERLKMMLKG
jgi:DNA-binding MarR family transcriptional regulator